MVVVFLFVFLFYGFMVLGFSFLGFLWFYGFLVSKRYQMSISCFQEATDPISMILKILFNGFSSCSVPVFSKIDKTWGFRNLEIYKNKIV